MILGIASLTFCFQEESVTILDYSDQDKEKAYSKLNKGFLMSGLFFTCNIIFGGIGYVSDRTDLEGRTPLSVSDYYIKRNTLERVLMSAVAFAQLLPLVPIFSLKAASFVDSR